MDVTMWCWVNTSSSGEEPRFEDDGSITGEYERNGDSPSYGGILSSGHSQDKLAVGEDTAAGRPRRSMCSPAWLFVLHGTRTYLFGYE